MKSLAIPKPKILVVDDEPDNLDLLYRTFYREYKVLRAESGPAALEILEQEGDVAVIISDQRMPMMSGTEFLSLTATRYPDIIRIILTGYTDVEDLVEAINAGKVFKFVTKPWDAEELKLLVRQAWDTHNVLKVRTEELTRSLRRESLLNTVTNTIRNAQYGRLGTSPLKQILQIIVNTVGHMLEIDVCILRPFQEKALAKEWFIYQKSSLDKLNNGSLEEKLALVTPTLSNSSSSWGETVWETQDIEVINDVALDDRFLGDEPENNSRRSTYQQANIHSSLIVPLISQQSLIAVMALHQCGEPYQWEDDEIQLVVMVADQAALALSQARAFEQLRALATQQALVNTITTAIRSSLDPQEIFTAITQQLGEALDVDGCALSLWRDEDEFVQLVGLYEKVDPNNSRFQIAQSHNLSQSMVPIAGNPVLQQLLITSQPVVIDDLAISPELNGYDLPLRTPARALLLVPLLSDGKIIGSITLRQVSKSRIWQAADITLAQAVASQASIAVQQSRLYQKTRQQAERLMELDRQKTEFFQNISHEFRTPLTLMIGPLESAAYQKADLPHDQAVIALRNSRRLLRLVNQLLDLQRLDAGRMQASFRPCSLVEFVQQVVEAFRPYCEKKGLTVTMELVPCPVVYLDIEKFDKVLYNLLSNAMKFTGTNGRITVRLEPAGNHVRLQVCDTGIGIRPEQIPHLFERFRQAEGSVNRSYEGSGLGLALVKELVEMHGGQISVESEYEHGTTFNVWLHTGTGHLPLDQVLEVPTEIQASRALVELADLETELQNEEEEINPLLLDVDGYPDLNPVTPLPSLSDRVRAENLVSANSADSPGASNLPPASKGRILVVDDNPDLRNYVSGILRECSYEVLMARNGREGFQVAQRYKPQLIVTDLMMPEVSGLELVQLIRQEPLLQGIPIILLTAKADEMSRLEGTEQGADAYLAKPFNDRELLAEVRNLLALKANEQKVVELNQYLTQSVLSRFLPPGMVEKAATGEMSLDLRPEPKLITILFSDIVGFTQLANTLRSRRVAELLNEYLEAMTRAVFANGGTVDKFMGDAILALFGAPEELTPNEQVRRAIAAARQMQVSLAVLNQKWQELGIVGDGGPPPVQFRCGIHQGTAVVGMFGGAERSDYTAIGPSVNIAARLQQAAQPNSILVSAAVADYLEEGISTKGSPLKLKGVDETVLTFVV